jgi:putative flippase GtrA
MYIGYGVRQFLPFAVFSGSALAMNLGIVFITVEMLSLHYLVGKVCAIVITFFWNYLAQSRFTFHTPGPVG